MSARIGAIVGEAGDQKQALLWDFIERRRAEGLRVAGLVERHAQSAPAECGAHDLVDLATGARFAVAQDLGPGSTACNLDPGGVALACAAALRAIAAGADVVVLSKFGKLETERGGLCDAFAAAVVADLPVLTTLKPLMRPDWARFAGPLSDELPASRDAIDHWWRGFVRAAA